MSEGIEAPPETRDALEEELGGAFDKSGAPGAIVGAWTPEEGTATCSTTPIRARWW